MATTTKKGMRKTELVKALKAMRSGDTNGEELPTLEDIKNERRRRSLIKYVEGSLDEYEVGWIHEEVCNELMQFLQDCLDKKSPRLMLFMPPRHGKSELASRRFPAWCLGHHPKLEFIVSSYSADLSTSFSSETQELCGSEYHHGVFPEFELGNVQKSHEWYTKQRGVYKATGVDGSISGRGADIFIIDDPVKNWEDAYSVTKREKAWNWFASVAVTRLSPGAGILLIMTRWHEDDLAGRILASEGAKDWKVIEYPAIAVKKEEHRDIGDALHEARYDIDRLRVIERTVGKRIWASLYQQRPRIIGGHHIKREWFNIVNSDEVPEGMQWRRFWDLAIKAKQSSDFTASVKMARDHATGNIYIANVLCFKREWPSTKKIIINTAKVELIPIGIETVSAFEIALQEIKPKLKGFVKCRGYGVTSDKLSRALPWIDLAENGKVFLVLGDWTDGFISECERFDPIKDSYHDDQVDATSGAYQMIKKVSTRPRILR